MRALIVRPRKNRPGLHDYTGAFRPESNTFAAWWRGRSGGQAAEVLELGEREPVDALLTALGTPRQPDLYASPELHRLAFFCHGGPRALYIAGLRVAGVREGKILQLSPFVRFCEKIAMCAAPGAIVTLYACSAGGDVAGAGVGGDGGFADMLRDTCAGLGVPLRVDAHATAGHTTRNPHVRRFDGEIGGVGGSWLVAPRSALWRTWSSELRRGDLRWHFPHLEAWEIHELLRGRISSAPLRDGGGVS